MKKSKKQDKTPRTAAGVGAGMGAAAAFSRPTTGLSAAAAGFGGMPVGTGGGTLGYRRGPSAAERAAAARAVTLDPNRDVYAPLAFLLVGMLLHVGYYALRYNLGITGITAVTFGLSIVSAIETALLFVFAISVAGPLGVSFGGIWTALLKLAAIAVFCDGGPTSSMSHLGRHPPRAAESGPACSGSAPSAYRSRSASTGA